jgi:hypothetical protein
MNRVKDHYKEYPKTIENFEKWRLQTVALFKEAASKVMK